MVSLRLRMALANPGRNAGGRDTPPAFRPGFARSLHDAAFHQLFRALHGVARSALAEIVGDHPQAQGVRATRVLPHAADKGVIAPLGMDWLGELAVLEFV